MIRTASGIRLLLEKNLNEGWVTLRTGRRIFISGKKGGSAQDVGNVILQTQTGLRQSEIWKLRKQTQRLVPITKDSKSAISGSKDKLQRHHIDGNIRNNTRSNIIILTESEHIKAHQEAGTSYHRYARAAD